MFCAKRGAMQAICNRRAVIWAPRPFTLVRPQRKIFAEYRDGLLAEGYSSTTISRRVATCPIPKYTHP